MSGCWFDGYPYVLTRYRENQEVLWANYDGLWTDVEGCYDGVAGINPGNCEITSKALVKEFGPVTRALDYVPAPPPDWAPLPGQEPLI